MRSLAKHVANRAETSWSYMTKNTTFANSLEKSPFKETIILLVINQQLNSLDKGGIWFPESAHYDSQYVQLRRTTNYKAFKETEKHSLFKGKRKTDRSHPRGRLDIELDDTKTLTVLNIFKDLKEIMNKQIKDIRRQCTGK